MRIDLQAANRECWQVYLNGRMVAEGIADWGQGPDGIMAEVRRARALHGLPILIDNQPLETDSCTHAYLFSAAPSSPN